MTRVRRCFGMLGAGAGTVKMDGLVTSEDGGYRCEMSMSMTRWAVLQFGFACILIEAIQ
jgi:hypothetical protein